MRPQGPDFKPGLLSGAGGPSTPLVGDPPLLPRSSMKGRAGAWATLCGVLARDLHTVEALVAWAGCSGLFRTWG